MVDNDGVKELAEKRRGIQSVEIGLRVLSAVAGARGPQSLSSIAQASELSVSQAHRYLASLMATGMVRQEGRSGLYDLDQGAIRIGLAALSRLDVFALADEAIRAVADRTGRTCLIAVWGDSGPVVVRWFPGDPPVVTSLGIGSTLPVLRSSTGRIFYAFAEDALTRNRVQSEAGRMGLRSKELEDMRAKVRAAMAARVEGDLIPGLRAASAPVFDLQGRLVLAATMIANGNFETAGDDEAGATLVEACRSLTITLGGDWHE